MKSRPQGTYGRQVFTYYYQPFIIVNQEENLYDLLQVMAEIAGYVGVLLGISILQGVTELKGRLRNMM